MSSFNRMFKNCLIISLILGVFAINLFAEGAKEKPPDKPNGALVFLILEGTCAAYSGLYIASPKVVGIVNLVLLPISVGGVEPTPSLAGGITLGMGFAGLAIYNISVLSKDNISDKTIFARNMIGMHAIGLALVAVNLLFPSEDTKTTAWNIDLVLNKSEPLLVVSYKF